MAEIGFYVDITGVKHKKKLKEKFPNRNFISVKNRLEGTGDNIYDSFRGYIWSGYQTKNSKGIQSGRSSQLAHKEIEEKIEMPLFSNSNNFLISLKDILNPCPAKG